MNEHLLKEAEYMDIILSLLQEPYNIDSLIKIVFISFCIHNESNLSKYTNRKQDFVDTFIENISFKLEVNRNELISIFRVLDILRKQKIIDIADDKIIKQKTIEFNTQNALIQKCASGELNPISETNKLDSKALLEEVIRYV